MSAPDSHPGEQSEQKAKYDFDIVGLPRGAGDPDIYGYPGQKEAEEAEANEPEG